MKKRILKAITILLSQISILFMFSTCKMWMSDESFFTSIEDDVKVANAQQLYVFVRYPDTKMGTTTPNGAFLMKEGVESTVSALTNTDYGFYKWAVFKLGTETGEFNSNKQNTSMYFKDEESYEESYGKYELGSDIVSFGSPYEQTTTVTVVKKPSYNIAIVPIVIKRLEYIQSVPIQGQTQVVKNQTIRILFSKGIDPETITDNIRITSGSATISESTEDTEASDITDKFDITLSPSKKLLTLKLKTEGEGESRKQLLMDSNAYITITIYSDLKDLYGFNMAENQKINFTVGPRSDSLAPIITILRAGLNGFTKAFDALDSFQSENEDKNTNYISSKDIYDDVKKIQTDDGKDINSLTHRITDGISLYVFAEDMSGAGANKDTNFTEADVSTISYKAELCYNLDGSTEGLYNEKGEAIYSIPKKSIAYMVGDFDTSYPYKKTFKEASETNSANGMVYYYDLSSLPDGLIRIDVWATDMIGNEGDKEAYYLEHGNGYRSLYVVKDTTAPLMTSEQIKSYSEGADYGWYNAETFASIKLSDVVSNKIKDVGSEKLSSERSKLKWMFKLEPEENWLPSSEDSGWRTIDSGYELNFASINKQGVVNVKASAMDDMGNVSVPVSINAIKYDDVLPEVNKLSWSAINGTAGITTGAVLSDQILKVEFKEVTSGVKKISVSVKKQDSQGEYTLNSTAEPLNSAALEIKYVDEQGAEKTLVKGTDYTVKDNDKIILNDSVTSGYFTFKGIKVNDNPEDSEGYYLIKAELMDTAMNTNSSSSKNEVSISNDSTAPVINKILIDDICTQISYEDDSKTFWLGESNHGNSADKAPDKVAVNVYLTETNSGVKTVKLGGTVTLLSETKLLVDGKVLTSSAYEADLENNIITFKVSPDKGVPVVKSGSELVLRFENLKFQNYSSSETLSANKNNISIELTDFALNKSVPKTKIAVAGEVQEVSEIYAYNSTHSLDGVTSLADRTASSEITKATAGYTNETYVNVQIKTNAAVAPGSDGINKLEVSGFNFVTGTVSDDTVVKVSSDGSTWKTLTKETDYTYSSSKQDDTLDVISFTKAFPVTKAYLIQFNNVCLSSSEQVAHTIEFNAVHVNGMKTTDKVSASIILDTTVPLWDGASITDQTKGTGVFTVPYSGYDEGSSDKNIYPHESSLSGTKEGGLIIDSNNPDSKNADGVQIRYFYTRAKKGADYGAVLGIPATDNIALRGVGKSVFYYYYIHNGSEGEPIDSSFVLAHGINPSKDMEDRLTTADSKTSDYQTQWFGCGTYSVVIMDEAGNHSPAYTFTVVEDSVQPALTVDGTAGGSSLISLMSLDVPESINKDKIFRNTISKEYKAESYDFRDGGTTSSSSKMYTFPYVFKKTGDNIKVKINLGTGLEKDSILIGGDKTTVDVPAYSESRASSVSSGIESYSITHWYGNWNSVVSADGTAVYEPAFPEATVTPTGVSIKDYFGFAANSYSTWKTSNCSWHPYVKSSGKYTDTDVESYVDSDGNIVVIIPNTKDTPPLTLLLRDGCGNLNYVMINSTDFSAENKKAVSWISDGAIGEGLETGRNVIMNPGLEQFDTKTSDADFYFGGKFYKWNDQAGSYYTTSSHSGLKAVGRIMKDDKKFVNYYNDKVYISLGPKEGYENFLFDSTNSYDDISNNRYQGSETEYTLKAKLYASKSDTKPLYAEIANDATSKSSPWSYVKMKSISNDGVFVLEYPHVDYAALGWNSSEAYYIYYLIEDAVGNYEINTVVNDSENKYNKWLYDNEAPVVTVRNTTKSPADISLDEIHELVPDNNGYRSYSDGIVGYVSSIDDSVHLNTRRGLQNTNLGENTTRHVEGSTDNSTESRKNLPFFDIEVSEATGVRAFCYSKISTPPAYTKIKSDGNSQGDNGTDWYAGYDIRPSEWNYAIGGTTYGPDKQNTYNTESVYGGSWTGTKVNTVMPYSYLTEDSATDIYLHVMDWVGNIKTYKMGNFKWKNDITVPGFNESQKDVETFDYIMNKHADHCDGTLVIAGCSENSRAGNDLIVYLEDDWYKDSGSGLYGWSIESGTDVASVKFDEDALSDKYGKSYFEIKKTSETRYKYGYNETPTSRNLYVYDKVGNMGVVNYEITFDDIAPVLTLNTESSDYVYTAGGSYDEKSLSEQTVSESNYVDNPETSEKVQTVYCKAADFTVKFSVPKTLDDFRTLKIRKWNSASSEWGDVADYASKSTYWTKDTESNFDNDIYEYKLSGFTTAYYELSVKDLSGNINYKYLKLVYDSTPPEFISEPDFIPVKGSVNKSADGTWYYNQAEIKFTAQDAVSGNRRYRLVGTKSAEEVQVNAGSLTDTEVVINTKDIENVEEYSKFAVDVYDKLDNGSSKKTVSYNGTQLTKIQQDSTVPAVPQAEVTYNDNGDRITASSFALREQTKSSSEKDSTQYSYEVSDGKGTVHISATNVTKITFTPECESTDVMGYIELAENATPYTAPDSYHAEDVKNSFEHNCSSTNSSADIYLKAGESKTYKYYAVDYAGNISEPLTVTYKYSRDTVPIITDVKITRTASSDIEDSTGYGWKTESKNPVDAPVDAKIITNNDVNFFKNLGDAQFIIYCTLKSSRSSFYPQELRFYVGDTYIKSYKTVDPDKKFFRYVNSSVTDGRYNCACVITAIPESDSTDSVWVELVSSTGVSDRIELKDTAADGVYKSAKWGLDASGPGNIGSDAVRLDVVDYSEGFYADTAAKKNYFKSDSDWVTLKPYGFQDVQSGMLGYSSAITGTEPVCPDNENTTVKLTALESKTYKIYAWDKLGNKDGGTSFTLIQDDVKPTLSTVVPEFQDNDKQTADLSYYTGSAVTYYFNGNKVKNLKFALTGSDTASGIKGYKYKTGDGTYSEIITDGIVSLAAPSSEESYSFCAVDNVGNESSVQTITLIPDIAAPNVTEISVSYNVADTEKAKYTSGDYINSNVIKTLKVSGTGDDSGSGLPENPYFYTEGSVYNGTNAFVRTSGIVTVDLTGLSGEKTYYFYAVDKVGNYNLFKTVSLKADGTVPELETGKTLGVTVESNGVYEDSANSRYYFTGKASDSLSMTFANYTDKDSGFLGYSIGNTEKPVLDTTKLNFNMSAGTYKIYAWDKVGNNVEVASYELIKDTAGPVVSDVTLKFAKDLSEVDSSKYVYNETGTDKYTFNSNEINKVLFTVTASDAGSGIKAYKYKIGDGEYTAAASSQITLDLDVTASTVYTIGVEDNLGNVTEKTYELIPDGTAPDKSSYTITPGVENPVIAGYVKFVETTEGYDCYANIAKINKQAGIKFEYTQVDSDATINADYNLKNYDENNNPTFEKDKSITEPTSLSSTLLTKLTFKATDKVGNEGTVYVVTIINDGEGPEVTDKDYSSLTVTGNNANGDEYKFIKEDSVASFTASDSTGLSAYGFYLVNKDGTLNQNTAVPSTWYTINNPETVAAGLKFDVELNNAKSVIGNSTDGNLYLAVKDGVSNISWIRIPGETGYFRSYSAFDTIKCVSNNQYNTCVLTGSISNAIKSFVIQLPDNRETKNQSLKIWGTALSAICTQSDDKLTVTLEKPLLTGSDITITWDVDTPYENGRPYPELYSVTDVCDVVKTAGDEGFVINPSEGYLKYLEAREFVVKGGDSLSKGFRNVTNAVKYLTAGNDAPLSIEKITAGIENQEAKPLVLVAGTVFAMANKVANSIEISTERLDSARQDIEKWLSGLELKVPEISVPDFESRKVEVNYSAAGKASSGVEKHSLRKQSEPDTSEIKGSDSQFKALYLLVIACVVILVSAGIILAVKKNRKN